MSCYFKSGWQKNTEKHMSIEKIAIKYIIISYNSNKSFEILEYWEMKIFSHPEIYKLSQIVLSIPARQRKYQWSVHLVHLH